MDAMYSHETGTGLGVGLPENMERAALLKRVPEEIKGLPYFYPKISGCKEATVFVKDNSRGPGYFLLRLSSKGDDYLALTICIGKKEIRHVNVRIQRQPSLQFYVIPQLMFDSFQELKAHYTDNHIGNLERCRNVKLIHPINRGYDNIEEYEKYNAPTRPKNEPKQKNANGRNNHDLPLNAVIPARCSPGGLLGAVGGAAALNIEDENYVTGSMPRPMVKGKKGKKRKPNRQSCPPLSIPNRYRPLPTLPQEPKTSGRNPQQGNDVFEQEDKEENESNQPGVNTEEEQVVVQAGDLEQQLIKKEVIRPPPLPERIRQKQIKKKEDAETNPSHPTKSRKGSNDRGICDCGIPHTESQLAKGWTLHKSMDAKNKGRLFFHGPKGETTWQLPHDVLGELTAYHYNAMVRYGSESGGGIPVQAKPVRRASHSFKECICRSDTKKRMTWFRCGLRKGGDGEE